MPDRAFRELLSESLERIAADSPGLYRRIGERLGERALSLVVDGEPVTVRARDGRILLEDCIRPVVHAYTTRSEIVALADGASSLEEAIVTERVHLAGTVEDLLACLDALSAYLHAAVRSPELGDLLDELRSDVARKERLIAGDRP